MTQLYWFPVQLYDFHDLIDQFNQRYQVDRIYASIVNLEPTNCPERPKREGGGGGGGEERLNPDIEEKP